MKRVLIFLYVIMGSQLLAELPYSFTELAHYDPDGIDIGAQAYDVAVHDSLVFSTFGEAGLFVHQMVDSKLTYLTHLADGVDCNNLIIAPNGDILVAAANKHIYAYRYENGNLLRVGYLKTTSKTQRMAIGRGNTVYLAVGRDGLWAYEYIDGNFNYITRIIESAEYRCAYGLDVDSKGNIFMANEIELRCYVLKDSMFVRVAKAPDLEYGSFDVSLLNDSTLVSVGYYLSIYSFKDSIFTQLYSRPLPSRLTPFSYLSRGVRVVSEGQDKIFISVQDEGLYSYSYNNDVSLKAQDYNQTKNYGICISGEHVFQANTNLGLAVFDHSQNNLDWIDNYNLNECAYKLEIGQDDKIYVANGRGGLNVFEFKDNEFELIEVKDRGHSVRDVDVSDDGNYLSAAEYTNGLKVYSLTDESLTQIYHNTFRSNGGNYVKLHTYSTKFGKNKVYSGSYYYSYDMNRPRLDYEGGLIHHASIEDGVVSADGDWGYEVPNNPVHINLDYKDEILVSAQNDGFISATSDIVINRKTLQSELINENIFLLANASDGMYAYDYDSTAQKMTKKAYVNGLNVKGFKILDDQLILAACNENGIIVFNFENSLFTRKAQSVVSGQVFDVALLSDSTIIIANAFSGIRAFSYNGFSDTSTSQHGDSTIVTSFVLNDNYPNPFNPITTLSYNLYEISDISMIIYDVSGHPIKQWECQNQISGIHEITWDGKNQYGNSVPSGVYVYTLVAGDHVESKKMVLLK